MTTDLPGEVWRTIGAYEDIYEVSNLGRVRSLARTIEVRAQKRAPYLMRLRERILTPSFNGRTLSVKLSREDVQEMVDPASLVAAAFLGSCPPDKVVARGDGDRRNARLDNLTYAARDDIRRAAHERAGGGE